MKTAFALPCLLFLAAFVCVSPAAADLCNGADNLYCNGPGFSNNGVYGLGVAVPIDAGSSVTDWFTAAGTMTGFDIGVWLFPGDSLNTVQWSIGTSAFGSNVAQGIASAVQESDPDECGTFYLGNVCSFTNPDGYSVITYDMSLTSTVALSGGTYWLTLQNATTANGDPVFWDINSGPSSAQISGFGYGVPSEAFAINGATTPEPQTLAMLGSVIALMFGVFRRKLRK